MPKYLSKFTVTVNFSFAAFFPRELPIRKAVLPGVLSEIRFRDRCVQLAYDESAEAKESIANATLVRKEEILLR